MLHLLPYELLLQIITYFNYYNFCNTLRLNKCLRNIILEMIGNYPKSFSFNLKKSNIIKINLSLVKNVKYLNLSHTNVSDDHLQSLSDIYELNLKKCNNITGTGFKYLNNLKKINISWCRKLKSSELQYLKNVVKINLSRSNINDEGIKYLIFNNAEVDNLIPQNNIKQINLSNTNITNDSIKFLSEIPIIKINYCPHIDASCLEYLSTVKSLSIRLTHDRNTNLCENLKHLKNIERLKLNTSFLTGQHLKYLNNLKVLDAQNSRIEFKDIDFLNKLEYLSMRFNDYLDHFDAIHFKNLRVLKLPHCQGINDNCLKNLGGLKKINIKRCLEITDSGLESLSNIPDVNISGCLNITDKGLKSLKNVKKLNIRYCYGISNEGLKYLENVEKIKIGYHDMYDITIIEYDHATDDEILYCDKVKNSSQNISDLGLSYLNNITILKLKKCNSITDEGLLYFKNIKKLELKYCNNIKGKFMKNFKNTNIKIFGNNIKREYLKAVPNIKCFKKNILENILQYDCN
uniref:F-box and FNIp repeat-containing protein n=1 Tax=Borely moumouvirus TaxID=2712067 RepID=A0A6G6AD15_9VIRU